MYFWKTTDCVKTNSFKENFRIIAESTWQHTRLDKEMNFNFRPQRLALHHLSFLITPSKNYGLGKNIKEMKYLFIFCRDNHM